MPGIANAKAVSVSDNDDPLLYSSTNGNWDAATGVFTPAAGDPSVHVVVGDFTAVWLDIDSAGVFIGEVVAVDAAKITTSFVRGFGTLPTTGTTGRTIKAGGSWKGPR